MDAMLAEIFVQLGGNLMVNSRWASSDFGEGIVSATGRRLPSTGKSPRWFGIKAHARNSSAIGLEADLEMHLAPDGYVGVSRIDNNQANVCGLFQARSQNRPDSKMEWLRGQPNSSLRRLLGDAQFIPDSFCSVAGIQLKPRRASEQNECCIGDALTMTPPVTGNGMSMAFESAEEAIGPLAAYSRGKSNWPNAQRQIAANCDASFSRRLAWARLLQWLIMSRAIQNRLGKFLLRSDWVWNLMFDQTR
jgi:2-polyprenyl-6-methoxyphenol hydroxylase-like FAD-dependent oxidoreductase